MGKGGFTDVLEGSAVGCGGGFLAEGGWDAVTGWGMPVSWISVVGREIWGRVTWEEFADVWGCDSISRSLCDWRWRGLGGRGMECRG